LWNLDTDEEVPSGYWILLQTKISPRGTMFIISFAGGISVRQVKGSPKTKSPSPNGLGD